jgi:1-aminocyclopropane-1-carboxylate deaminase
VFTYYPVIQSLPGFAGGNVSVLRLDLLDEEVSGNKWFKLKVNLEAAKAAGCNSIVTKGGPFSNHIAATAAACRSAGYSCTGFIRSVSGPVLNETLIAAQNNGMHLVFLKPSEYTSDDFIEDLIARNNYGYFIPEGGANMNGVKGCSGIIDPTWEYDHIFCACGTGTTFAGILSSLRSNTILTGVSVLKGENILPEKVMRLIAEIFTRKVNVYGDDILNRDELNEHSIISKYAFSGYARYNEELVAFKKEFEKDYNIPLDHIYTAKLFYAVNDLRKKGKTAETSSILIVHSGGLQGNKGFEQRYQLIPNL